MTAKEQDHADNIIREIEARRAHWYRVRWCIGLMAFGLVSLWALIIAVVEITHRLGGVQ